MEPTFFRTAQAFRKWLEKHHEHTDQLLVGFFKVDSGKGGLTYSEALDAALCYGWIDGVRRAFDESSYTIRFTPRKANSVWSTVNTKRAGELIAEGLMHSAGLAAFERRDEKKSQQYSYEVRTRKLEAVYEKQFRANAKAWEFFDAQAAWYQRSAGWYVMSAKKEETRLRRLESLIACCERGVSLPQFPGKPKLRPTST